MKFLLANRIALYEMSNLGLYCLPMPNKAVAMLIWVKLSFKLLCFCYYTFLDFLQILCINFLRKILHIQLKMLFFYVSSLQQFAVNGLNKL